MSNGEWPKSYVIPAVAVSATAVGFLVWDRLDHDAARVDGWTITLIVIAFLPWLRTIFESIDFPGGGSVKWRRSVEAEQTRQAKEIETISRFMFDKFLSDNEREALQLLASGARVPMNTDDAAKTHQNILSYNALFRYKLIRPKPEIVARKDRGESFALETFNELYDVTDSGREYLALIANLPATDG